MERVWDLGGEQVKNMSSLFMRATKVGSRGSDMQF